MSKLAATAAGCAAALAITGIMISAGVDGEVGATIAIIVAIIVYLVVHLKLSPDSYLLTDPMGCDKEKGSIQLSNRSAGFAFRLSVRRVHNMQLRDHPAELVYTGATVGGVTTGGFHVNEAYTTTHSAGITERGMLMAKDGSNWFHVEKIVLTESLASLAKTHPILKKYLRKNTLVLKNGGRKTKLTADEQAAAAAGNSTTKTNVGMRAAVAQQIPYADAKAIKAWICDR